VDDLYNGPALLGGSPSQDLNAAAQVLRSETGDILPINFLPNEGLRLILEVDDAQLDGIREFGLAYRLDMTTQSALAFVIDAEALRWRVDVLRGSFAQTLDEGRLSRLPARIELTSVGEFARILADDQLIQSRSAESFGQGVGLILRTDDARTPIRLLRALSVGIAGAEAYAAVEATPTPAAVISYARFLLDEALALRASVDLPRARVDCERYVRLFEGLRRHETRQDEAIVSLARAVRRASERLNERCIDEASGGLLILSDTNDLRRLDESISKAIADIQALAGP